MILLHEWKLEWDVEEGGGKHFVLLISQARKGSSWYWSRTKLNSSGAFWSNSEGLWESYFSKVSSHLISSVGTSAPQAFLLQRAADTQIVSTKETMFSFLIESQRKCLKLPTLLFKLAVTFLYPEWGLGHLTTLSRKKKKFWLVVPFIEHMF